MRGGESDEECGGWWREGCDIQQEENVGRDKSLLCVVRVVRFSVMCVARCVRKDKAYL